MENIETAEACKHWQEAREKGKPMHPSQFEIWDMCKTRQLDWDSFSLIWKPLESTNLPLSHVFLRGALAFPPEPPRGLSLNVSLVNRLALAHEKYRLDYTKTNNVIYYHICEILMRLFWYITDVEQPCSELSNRPTIDGIKKMLYNFQNELSNEEKTSFRDIINNIEKDERQRKQEKEDNKKVSCSKPRTKRTKRKVL